MFSTNLYWYQNILYKFIFLSIMYKGSLFSPSSSTLVVYGLFDGADYTLYTIEIESASFKTNCKCQVSTVIAYMPDESFSERFLTTERRAGREGLPW